MPNTSFMFEEVVKNFPNAQKSNSGLVFVIENEGEGLVPTPVLRFHCIIRVLLEGWEKI